MRGGTDLHHHAAQIGLALGQVPECLLGKDAHVRLLAFERGEKRLLDRAEREEEVLVVLEVLDGVAQIGMRLVVVAAQGERHGERRADEGAAHDLAAREVGRPAQQDVVGVVHVQTLPVVDDEAPDLRVVVDARRHLDGGLVVAVRLVPAEYAPVCRKELALVEARGAVAQKVGEQRLVAVPGLTPVALDALDEQAVTHHGVDARHDLVERQAGQRLRERDVERVDQRRLDHEPHDGGVDAFEDLLEQVVLQVVARPVDRAAAGRCRAVGAQQGDEAAAGGPAVREVRGLVELS